MVNIHWHKLPSAMGFVVTIPEEHPYFSEHIVRGKKVLPGVAYLDVVSHAVSKLFAEFPICSFEDVVWLRPIVCDKAFCEFNVLLSVSNEGILFEIMLDEALCGNGLVRKQLLQSVTACLSSEQAYRIINQSTHRITRLDVYAAFSKMGIHYGQYFQRINYVDIYQNQAVSLLSNHDGVQLGFVNLLDCAFQSGMAISIGEHTESLMPFSFGLLHYHQLSGVLNKHTYYVITEKKSSFRTNITICDDQYTTLLSVYDLGVKPSLLQLQEN